MKSQHWVKCVMKRFKHAVRGRSTMQIVGILGISTKMEAKLDLGKNYYLISL